MECLTHFHHERTYSSVQKLNSRQNMLQISQIFSSNFIMSFSQNILDTRISKQPKNLNEELTAAFHDRQLYNKSCANCRIIGRAHFPFSSSSHISLVLFAQSQGKYQMFCVSKKNSVQHCLVYFLETRPAILESICLAYDIPSSGLGEHMPVTTQREMVTQF